MPVITLPLCVRIDADDLFSRTCLLKDGWREIERLEVWSRDTATCLSGHTTISPPVELDGYVVVMATAAAKKACMWIASTSFVHDRLHKDPEVLNAVADRQKTQFVDAAFDSPEKSVFIARQKHAIYGFCIVTADDTFCTIDLVAVDRRHRKKGIGRGLIAHIAAVYKPLILVAGTQSTNKEGRALYESTGFEKRQTCLTFHKDRD